MKPGPLPNRTSDLSRARDAARGDKPPVTKGQLRPTRMIPPDPDWHIIAFRWYHSLATSGMADFYQDSDWAFAYSIAEDLSMYKKPSVSRDGEEYHKRSGQMLQTIYQAMAHLGTSEGHRRAMRIELESEKAEDDASVTAIASYKQALGLVPNPDE